ncbi:KR domain-containing protein [Xylariaceae sp. FL0662B]|nr:KR domain-containing protein [Xylariaceae sp. FL0662B]
MRFMQKGSHIGKIVVTMPRHPETLPARLRTPAFRLPRDASYILVGGLGGLGQAISIWMAEAGAAEIIFISRSATSRSYDTFLKELKAIGCDAIMVGGSVNNKENLRRAVRAASHRIGGVMQMSMVLNDTKLLDMSFKDWSHTVDTKVLGTWNLHNVLEEEAQGNVDFFLLFSSYSGLVGHWGQANYAAANTFLDAFTQYRHSNGLASATLDVGVMEDIGYVSRNAHVLGHFYKTSTHVLREKDLLDGIQLLLQRSAPLNNTGGHEYVNQAQIGLGVRSTQPLDAPNNRTVWKNDLRMAGYRNIEGRNVTATRSGNDQLKEFLSNVAADPGCLDTETSTDFLAREVGRTVLGFMLKDVDDSDLAGLDVRQSLKDIGVDSLVGIELRNWFRQSLGLDVSVIQLMESPSLLVLGARVGRMLKEKATGFSETNENNMISATLQAQLEAEAGAELEPEPELASRCLGRGSEAPSHPLSSPLNLQWA